MMIWRSWWSCCVLTHIAFSIPPHPCFIPPPPPHLKEYPFAEYTKDDVELLSMYQASHLMHALDCMSLERGLIPFIPYVPSMVMMMHSL